MRGPIDYIVVGFEGNKFDGSILRALGDAIDKGIVSLVSLVVIKKDETGVVTTLDITQAEDTYFVDFAESYKPDNSNVDNEDVDEVGELLENNTSAGLLVIEQLWARPLKQALLDANGVLVAEGRIHPDAAAELDK